MGLLGYGHGDAQGYFTEFPVELVCGFIFSCRVAFGSFDPLRSCQYDQDRYDSTKRDEL